MSGNKKLSINEEGSFKSFDDQKQSTGVFGGAFEENLSELAQIKYRAIDDEIMPPSIQNAQVSVETPKPIQKLPFQQLVNGMNQREVTYLEQHIFPAFKKSLHLLL